MKKLSCLLCACLVHCLGLAQTASDFKFTISYGLPAGSSYMGSNTVYNSNGGTSSESVLSSTGAGLNLGVGYSRRFTDRIGVDIDAQYLFGTAVKNTTDNNYSGNGGSHTNDVKSGSMRGVFITPSLVFYAPVKKIELYARAGMVAGYSKFYITDNFHVISYPSSSTPIFDSETLSEAKGNISFGFRGGLGAIVPLNSKISVTGEINFTAMTFHPTEMEVTSAKQNGKDILSTYLPFQKKTVYKNTIVYPSSPDINQPAVSKQSVIPLSSVALQIGVRYRIGATADVTK